VSLHTETQAYCCLMTCILITRVVFLLILIGDEKNTGIFSDAYQGLALYRCQTLMRGLNTFSFTCAVRYFKPLIMI
jgi:hypothetical protein